MKEPHSSPYDALNIKTEYLAARSESMNNQNPTPCIQWMQGVGLFYASVSGINASHLEP